METCMNWHEFRSFIFFQCRVKKEKPWRELKMDPMAWVADEWSKYKGADNHIAEPMTYLEYQGKIDNVTPLDILLAKEEENLELEHRYTDAATLNELFPNESQTIRLAA